MKNILNIARYDLKKITGSVVAIITILGLCLVPCSYAWFNILSNWAPYDSDATGRISVAVANADEGVNVAGLTINVGEKIVDALKANDDIGWVFVDSEEEAKAGVKSSKYYAALVVPEGFSSDALSFASGDLTNPKLKYYENEKKNAIAPKITSKAEAAVREEVNATFVETLAEYVSDAASIAKATGASPVTAINELSDKADDLSGAIESCIVLSKSAAGLTEAAGSLMDASGTLIDNTQNVLDENDKLLDNVEADANSKTAEVSERIAKIRDNAYQSTQNTDAYLVVLRKEAESIVKDPADAAKWNAFIKSNPVRIEEMKQRQKNAASSADSLNQADYTELAADYTELSQKLSDITAELESLTEDMPEADRKTAMETLIADIDAANVIVDRIETQTRTDISAQLSDALNGTRASVSSYRSALTSANKDLGKLSSLMDTYGNSLGKLQKNLDRTTKNLNALQKGTGRLADRLSGAAGNDLLQNMMKLMGNDESAVAEYMANPIKMDKNVIWPIANYGSQMAPFYTVLAQWVGALLTAVLIKVKVKKREDLQDPKLHERFFGRYGIYLAVGIAQALIVALGDLLYVRIQCLHPALFVLAACVNGLVFMMINYALVFALDNIGMGAGVIVLVLQVAGSGGTYPVEVLPPIFRALYPFMPFRYSMDAMRECIGGMYDDTYWKCLGILMLFFLGSVILGLLLYKPALWINNLIAESKAKSEIML